MNNVKKAYRLSIVLYLNNNKYKKSFESIIAQNNEKKERIQLLIIPSEKYKGDDLLGIEGEVNQNVKIKILNECKDIKQAYLRAEKYIDGEYINYMECGSIYKSGLFHDLFVNVKREAMPEIFLGKYVKEKNSFSKYFSGESGSFNFNQYKKVPFFFFSSCFFPGNLKFNFDFSEKCQELYLTKVLLDVIHNYPHLYIMENEQIVPYSLKKDFDELYEVYKVDRTIVKEFFETFLTGIYEKYQMIDMPFYVQCTMMSYLRWCVKEPEAVKVIGSLYNNTEFTSRLSPMLQKINDRYIFDNEFFNTSEQLFLSEIKYGKKPEEIETKNDIEFWYDYKKVSSVARMQIKMDFVEIGKSKIKFIIRESNFNCKENEIETYVLVNKKKKIPCINMNWPCPVQTFGRILQTWTTYAFEVPLNGKEKNYTIEIFSNYKGKKIKRTNMAFQRYMPIVGQLTKCYYYDPSGYILQYNINTATLSLKKSRIINALGKEIIYLFSLLFSRDPFKRKAFFSRLLYHFLKLVKRKPVWLISDRTNRGDDNGEAFLKYLNSISCTEANYYFVIDGNTEEGKRISKIAKTISPNSRKHKLYHLLSEYVISSQANNPVINPLGSAQKYYRDLLYRQKFIFLQHGVTKDNQSAWLKKFNRNIYGLIVTTNQEYESMFEYEYFYKPENIWLTGMPRNDLLYHDEKKQITLMPTWRKTLMSGADPVTGIWILKEGFKDSDYYKFYNELINDKRLLKSAKKYGYSICIKWHPNIEPYVNKFDKNEQVHFLEENVTYRQVFAETDLLITDYSSVAFDFAYLRKPIIYTQFDRDTFFDGGHSYTEGYYNYETDGFGPIAGNVDEAVSLMVSYMEQGCILGSKYLDRINNTFKFQDQNSSKRVYEKIMNNRRRD